MSSSFDLAIIGSGFSGSLLAAIARRLGLSVVLIEKSKHPRFAIGESSTPLANILLAELTTKYDLPRLRALSKWGTWQDQNPHIAGGLKRGFTFCHHEKGKPFVADAQRSNQLLVAASPNDRIGDTHWYRAAVDELFMQEAVAAGAEYLDQTRLTKMTIGASDVQLVGTRLRVPVDVRAKFIFDATGPRGFIHHAAGLFNRGFVGFPNTQGLMSHFYDVGKLEDLRSYQLYGEACPSAIAGGTDLIAGVESNSDRDLLVNGSSSQLKAELQTDAELKTRIEPPYPVDDAAVHHVFDGGWMWVLRFNNGLTSAGIAVTDEMAGHLRLATGEKAWARLLEYFPGIDQQFAGARLERPLIYNRRLSYLASATTGDRWAMLPSAAGFVDPLLSTGFPLTLLGLQRLANLLERDWGTDRFAAGIQDHAARTEREVSAAARLVAGLYRNMNNFSRFRDLSLLYFAAASFSETVRRLGKPELAGSFLLADDPKFGPAVAALLAAEPANDSDLRAQVLALIEPFDLAGLTRCDRKNWYPVDFDDLRAAAGKIEASSESVEGLIARCQTV
ncbi:MAG: NAD(P)-binding protein [Pyrinomonadaceae bacterium]